MSKNAQPNGKYQYAINDNVVYKHDGICRIVDIHKENFASTGEKLYYILEPIAQKSSTQIYVPVESKENGIRHLLGAGEIDAIISQSEEMKSAWIEDSKERAAKFTEILESQDRAKILWIIKMLSMHRLKVEKENRKFYVSDERILEMAENSLMEEFAFVLGIKKQDVVPYIMDKIQQLHPEFTANLEEGKQ